MIGVTIANSAVTPPASTGERLQDCCNRQRWMVNFTRDYSARVTVLIVGRVLRPMLLHPAESRLESASTFTQFTTRIRHFGPVLLGFPWKVIEDFGK